MSTVASPGNGWEQWGTVTHRRTKLSVTLWRKGRVCRYLTSDGVQVGPDQKNVAPALAWADQNGFRIL